MKSKIKEAIFKRINNEEDSYAVVGIEIKNRRIALSRTLMGVAYKICSVSYLSKIENNKILPNKMFVREICTKLDLSEQKIETLLNLKEILSDSVKAYLRNDISKLESFCIEGEDLNNYRSKMINLIYSISKKDLYDANKIYFEILPLATNMTDFDLIIFGLFSGILHFYNSEFDDAIEDLEMLVGLETIKEVKLLRDIYIYYSYYAQNRRDVVFEYKLLVARLNSLGEYDLLEHVHYIMGLYLVKNKSVKELDRLLLLIKNSRHKSSIQFLKKYINKERIKNTDFSDKNLNPFCIYLKRLMFNRDFVINDIKTLDDMVYSLDFDSLYLKYLLIIEPLEKLEYIDEIIIPKIFKSKENFLAEYYMSQYALLSTEIGRYKKFTEIYKNLKKAGII